jgi:hypothetical protein
MTEIPALRDALVDAAARRVRRRRRIVVRLFAWSAAAATACAVVLFAASAPPDRETPAVTPAPAGLLERAFPVFARPPRTGDALPAGVTVRVSRPQSRRVAEAGGVSAWLVSGVARGRQELCTVVASGSGWTSGCGNLDVVAREGKGTGSWQGTLVLLVLPAGSSDVTLWQVDGDVSEPALHNGAALVQLSAQPANVAWTGPSGTRYVRRYAGGPAAQPHMRCPPLRPLPRDASEQARRAALAAVQFIYPDVAAASVTGVSPLGPGLCSASVSSRTLVVSLRLVPRDPVERQSASLTQGRLLVGMSGPRMIVWSVQH